MGSGTTFAGPVISLGALMGDSKAGSQLDGPSISYQGLCLADPQAYPANKDGQSSARIPAWLDNGSITLTDNIPSAVSTTGLAAAAATVANTPMTLVTVSPGGGGAGVPSLACAVPFMAAGSTSVITVNALDFGFTTGNTIAGAAAVVVPDSTLFTLGQWLVIGGAGNAGKTASLICQVTALTDPTHINVSPTPAGTLNNAPIGAGNFFGQFPSGGSANAVSSRVAGGIARVFDPMQSLARCISITGNAGSSANNITVKGYDIFHNPMSELIAFAGGATTKFGQKAFKYIASLTPDTTDAGHLVSAGWGDTFGFHIRADRWECVSGTCWNNNIIPTGVGFLKPDATSPATTSTGDVRGTIQLSANGNGTPITAASATDGAKRLTIFMRVPVWNMLNATPANLVPLLGVAQV